jgi:hypothetical protein
MAEAKTKSKSKTVTCALCDKPITVKPVIIDDDPYHPDCAEAMSQSADETPEEPDEDEDEETEDDGEDEGDEDEEDEEEEEEPAPAKKSKVVAKAPAKAKRPVVVEDDDDEDDDDEDDEEEEEEVVVRKPAPKKAAPVAKSKKAVVVDDDDDEDEDDEDEDDDEEEEEEVVVPAKKKTAVATKPAPKTATKAKARVVEDDEEYEEEEEPEAKPKKAKTPAAAKPKVARVDNSGWGNPATEGSKRYFVFQAMHDVTKADLRDAEGPGKPESIIAAAKKLHRLWAKATKTSLSEKDQNYTSMNVNWIHNNADSLGLVVGHNVESGTYRIRMAKSKDADGD